MEKCEVHGPLRGLRVLPISDAKGESMSSTYRDQGFRVVFQGFRS